MRTGKTAPFEIWNTVLNRKAIWDIFYDAKTDTTDSLKNTWTSGDLIYIKDEFSENPQFTLKVTIKEHFYVTYEGRVNIPPKPGEAIHIALRRPFKTGDQSRIATTTIQKKETTFEPKSSVKVVPNPYIVGQLQSLKDDKEEPSCADHPFAEQGCLVNEYAAMAGASILFQILVLGQVKTPQVYFDSAGGRISPVYITKELFKAH